MEQWRERLESRPNLPLAPNCFPLSLCFIAPWHVLQRYIWRLEPNGAAGKTHLLVQYELVTVTRR